MTAWRSGLFAFIGAAALSVPASPVRVQAPPEPAKPAVCPSTGYTVTIDGAPDKGACRAFGDQASPLQFDIPAGRLSDGLKAFLEQSGARGWIPLGLDVARICPSAAAREKNRGRDCPMGSLQTGGVTGMMTPREALERLLAGTGTTFMQDQTGTYRFPPLQEAQAPGGRCKWDKAPSNSCPGQ
jgi:hypothetical protein